MRKGGRAVRLRLFDSLKKDLAQTVVGKQDVVLCPLCLNEFARDAAESGFLTEEHVIPESTGSKEVTLTCKSCNNTLGHQIDVHLDRKVKLDRTFKGGEPSKGKLQWDGGGSPVDLSLKDDGSIHFHLKPTSSYIAGKLAERFGEYESGARELRLRFIHRLSSAKYAAALVKAAYLGLFVDQGYSYVLLPSLEPVRKAIKEDGPDRERLFDVVLPCTLNGFTEIQRPPDRITFETRSLGGVPVCVSYVDLRGSSGGAFVVLPPGTSVNTGNWEGLARAAKALKQRPIFEVEMKSGGKMTLKLDQSVEVGPER